MKFFKRLKKELWRVIRTIILVGLVISLILSVISYGRKIVRPDAVSMIIDSDSGNEIDDLYAITYALINPGIEIIGLSSAQWSNHPRAGDSSVYLSQQINEDLLRFHDTLGTPHPIGANGPCGFWGDTKPIPSAAADFIISEVKKLGFKEKLNVVTLGAVTNLASAIQMDTTIASKICWYAMGLRYDDNSHTWNKNEFNVRNDLDAMDYLLNCEDLETHIMTATTSRQYIFDKRETFDLLEHRGPKWDYLVERWKYVAPDNNNWIMWDLALLHAIMNPDMVTEKEVWGPPENTRKRVYVYTWLDEKEMNKDFVTMVRKAMDDIAKNKKGR